MTSQLFSVPSGPRSRMASGRLDLSGLAEGPSPLVLVDERSDSRAQDGERHDVPVLRVQSELCVSEQAIWPEILRGRSGGQGRSGGARAVQVVPVLEL